MAIFDGTAIVRNLRKSVADQTFCKWRGLNIVKQKVGKSEKEPTEAQQQQHARWKAGAELQAVFAEATVIGFPERKQTASPENEFARENVTARVIEVAKNPSATGPDDKWTTSVNWELIRCAKGVLRLPRAVTVALSESGDAVTIDVAPEKRGPRREADDAVYALVVETEEMDSVLESAGTRGEGGSASVSLPTGWDATKVVVYLFVVSADGSRASNSRYVTLA